MIDQMLENPHIDVEKEFSKAISLVGGQRIDKLVGRKPGFRNADFLFRRYFVVAEMKCLEKDQIADSAFQAKVSDLYERCLREGSAPEVVFGRVRTTTANYPEWFQRGVAELYAKPIKSVIRSANEQIAQTKTKMNLSNFTGVLLLVNEGNSAMDPTHIRWSLGSILKDGAFSEINSVIYFTVNQEQEFSDPGIAAELKPVIGDSAPAVWMPCGRRDVPRTHPDFADAIRGAWFNHMSGIVGTVKEIQLKEGTPSGVLRNKR